MSQQSSVQRPRTKAWQFSLANLLVAISLIAATCGAFRLHISLGICMLHWTIAIAIAAARTRAAVRHNQDLWDALECPVSVRRMESTQIALNSLGCALSAIFLFYFGVGVALVLIAVTLETLLECTQGSDLLRISLGLVCVLAVPGTGLFLAGGWLKWTWPKSYFTRTPPHSSPSDKTG